MDLSDPSSVNYTANDFFSFFEVVCNFDPINMTSTQFSFLVTISSYLLTNQDQQIDAAPNY